MTSIRFVGKRGPIELQIFQATIIAFHYLLELDGEKLLLKALSIWVKELGENKLVLA